MKCFREVEALPLFGSDNQFYFFLSTHWDQYLGKQDNIVIVYMMSPKGCLNILLVNSGLLSNLTHSVVYGTLKKKLFYDYTVPVSVTWKEIVWLMSR